MYKKIVHATFFLLLTVTSFAHPANAATNLLTNGGMETTDGADPLGWYRGGWGTNTRTYTYPAPGHTGNGVSVSVTAYTNGDAKWYFDKVPVIAGTQYTYSEWYKSSVPTDIGLEYTMNDGTLTYALLAKAKPASTNWSQLNINFTPPAGAISVIVFHVLKSSGTLDIDDVSINTTSTPPTPPPAPPTPPPAPPLNNLITNSSLETAGVNGDPVNWLRGGWGTNSAVFEYPVGGYDGASAARLSITSYSGGDAKWYFTPVNISSGRTYNYSNYYKSDATTVVTVRYTLADGTFVYVGVGTLPPAANWTVFSKQLTPPSNAVGLTVFHSLITIGTLTIDKYALSETGGNTDPTLFPAGMVTFTFDDGWVSQLQNALPILNNAGYKATFGIITQEMINAAPSGNVYMSAAQVLSLKNAGHEIASHTVTHASLSSISQQQMIDEITRSKSSLAALGINASTLLYPYGDYNNAVESQVQSAGYIGARSVDRGYNSRTTNKYELKIQQIDTATSIETMKSWIDSAAQNKTWLILMFHQVDNSNSFYSITPANLKILVDYVKTKNLSVSTLEQGIAKM